MSQRPGLGWAETSTASRILVIGGALYIMNLFLPWQRACIPLDIPGIDTCGEIWGLRGIGTLNLVIAIALVAWEGMGITGVEIKAPRALISATLAGATLAFTIVKILVSMDAMFLFAWIGLILALVIGYGGWMRWQEHQASGGGGFGGGTAPPPPSGDMGMTS
jgi:hypothetical protein